jgi:hypothetical protein
MAEYPIYAFVKMGGGLDSSMLFSKWSKKPKEVTYDEKV